MSDQGSAYAEFIAGELKREYERRDRIDARSVAVATGAAGLITVALAALAVVKGKDFTVQGPAAAALVLTVLAFLASAAFATLATANWRYDVATSTTLVAMLSSHWQDSEVTARNHTARVNVRTLITLRSGNNRKSSLLLAALAAQVVAVLGLAATVAAIW